MKGRPDRPSRILICPPESAKSRGFGGRPPFPSKVPLAIVPAGREKLGFDTEYELLCDCGSPFLDSSLQRAQLALLKRTGKLLL